MGIVDRSAFDNVAPGYPGVSGPVADLMINGDAIRVKSSSA